MREWAGTSRTSSKVSASGTGNSSIGPPRSRGILANGPKGPGRQARLAPQPGQNLAPSGSLAPQFAQNAPAPAADGPDAPPDIASFIIPATVMPSPAPTPIPTPVAA